MPSSISSFMAEATDVNERPVASLAADSVRIGRASSASCTRTAEPARRPPRLSGCAILPEHGRDPLRPRDLRAGSGVSCSVADGRIAEWWPSFDALALMRQIGALPEAATSA
jgi:hypothetical protein